MTVNEPRRRRKAGGMRVIVVLVGVGVVGFGLIQGLHFLMNPWDLSLLVKASLAGLALGPFSIAQYRVAANSRRLGLTVFP